MRPVLRRFFLSAAIVTSLGVLAIGWIASAFLFSPCDYTLTHARISPSERYVAEIYRAGCGVGGSRSVVMLRDRSALSLARVDEGPPGTVVVDDFTPARAGEDIFWDGETTLVLQYVSTAPEIVRDEWGGVRVTAQRAP